MKSLQKLVLFVVNNLPVRKYAYILSYIAMTLVHTLHGQTG